MGAGAHIELANWIDELSGNMAVEFGSDNGDGSTAYFAELFAQHSMQFHTIDVDRKIYNNVRYIPGVTAHCGDHQKIFQHYTDIGFAYLDSFDYPPPGCETHDWFLESQQKYREWGTELTMENSAQVHLEQAQFVNDRASEKCLMIIDDTFDIKTTNVHSHGIKVGFANGYRYPSEGLYGKGMTAVPWLLQNGWNELDKQITDRDDYVILCNF